jgi:hypothetical protein
MAMTDTRWDAGEIDLLEDAADDLGEEAVRAEMAQAVCTRADAIRRLLSRSGGPPPESNPISSPDPLAQSAQTG